MRCAAVPATCANCLSSGFDEFLLQVGSVFWYKPYLERGDNCVVAAKDGRLNIPPSEIYKLQRGKVPHFKSGGAQHFERLRPTNSNRGHFAACIRELNLVHDDVTPEGRRNLFFLILGDIQQDRLPHDCKRTDLRGCGPVD